MLGGGARQVAAQRMIASVCLLPRALNVRLAWDRYRTAISLSSVPLLGSSLNAGSLSGNDPTVGATTITFTPHRPEKVLGSNWERSGSGHCQQLIPTALDSLAVIKPHRTRARNRRSQWAPSDASGRRPADRRASSPSIREPADIPAGRGGRAGKQHGGHALPSDPQRSLNSFSWI